MMLTQATPLTDAKYISSLSHIHGAVEDRKHLEVIQSHIVDYLFEVSRGGHGIIKTVPVFVDHTDPHSFHDVSYKVLTENEITIETYANTPSVSAAPIVVIFGVCAQRHLAAFTSKWSLGWLPSGTSDHAVGTVWFSKESFLEGRLLRVLELLNARTAVVPQAASAENRNGQWNCELTTLDKHKSHSGHVHACNWRRVKNNSPRFLEYGWEHHADWQTREGDSLSEGEYSLACECSYPKPIVHGS